MDADPWHLHGFTAKASRIVTSDAREAVTAYRNGPRVNWSGIMDDANHSAVRSRTQSLNMNLPPFMRYQFASEILRSSPKTTSVSKAPSPQG